MTYLLTWLLTICASIAASFVSAAQTPDASAAGTAIVRADEEFCRAVVDRNIERFRALVAEDAVFNGGTPNALKGRDGVAKGWAPFFEAEGPRITWKPEKSEVLPAGDVGYTVGTWERQAKGKDGKTGVAHGHYMTVWRKQADGHWQAVFDTGGEDPGR